MKKYKIGEYVLYYLFGKKVKCKVVGYDSDIDECIVKLNENKYVAVKFEYLSPLKKPDELEIGDKFKIETATGTTDRINQVLGVFKDEKYNQIKYVAKRVQGDWKGFVDIYNSEIIAEIIYD